MLSDDLTLKNSLISRTEQSREIKNYIQIPMDYKANLGYRFNLYNGSNYDIADTVLNRKCSLYFLHLRKPRILTKSTFFLTNPWPTAFSLVDFPTASFNLMQATSTASNQIIRNKIFYV